MYVKVFIQVSNEPILGRKTKGVITGEIIANY